MTPIDDFTNADPLYQAAKGRGVRTLPLDTGQYRRRALIGNALSLALTLLSLTLVVGVIYGGWGR